MPRKYMYFTPILSTGVPTAKQLAGMIPRVRNKLRRIK